MQRINKGTTEPRGKPKKAQEEPEQGSREGCLKPILSLRLRGGLGWWFGSLGNHCLQHILLKFKVCT